MIRRAALFSLFLLAACDSTGLVSGSDGVFRTDGSDTPSAAVLLANGDLVVGALVNGTIAPTDGTIGFPALVRFRGDDVQAAVYDEAGRSYSGVSGVVPLGDGLAIAMAPNPDLAMGSRPDVTVYRTDAEGRSREVLFRLPGVSFLPDDALTATSRGLVLAVYPTRSGDPQLYGLSPSGRQTWTYTLPGAQDVRAVSAAPGGDLFVVGVESDGDAVIARVSGSGEERWHRGLASSAPVDVAATADGTVVIVETREGRDRRAVVLRLDAEGSVVWKVPVGSAGAGWPMQVAALADGTVVAAVSTDDGDFETGNEASLVVLEPGGTERRTVRVGTPGRATTWVKGLLPDPYGRLVVVAAVGPGRLGGYGGDDFDIRVARLDVRKQGRRAEG